MFQGGAAARWLQENLSGFLTAEQALAIGNRMLEAKCGARRAGVRWR